MTQLALQLKPLKCELCTLILVAFPWVSQWHVCYYLRSLSTRDIQWKIKQLLPLGHIPLYSHESWSLILSETMSRIQSLTRFLTTWIQVDEAAESELFRLSSGEESSAWALPQGKVLATSTLRTKWTREKNMDKKMEEKRYNSERNSRNVCLCRRKNFICSVVLFFFGVIIWVSVLSCFLM